MTAPPAEEIVRIAARWINHGRRVDTSVLARELGVSRATLFRRVGNREALLGHALNHLSEQTLAAAARKWTDTEGDVLRSTITGELRCLGIMREYRMLIATSAGFQRFLNEEAALAIRLLTDPAGHVQPRVVTSHIALLQRDADEGGFVPAVNLDSLCYAVVRLGEAFLYSDVVASRTPDLEAASTLLAALVEGQRPAEPCETSRPRVSSSHPR